MSSSSNLKRPRVADDPMDIDSSSSSLGGNKQDDEYLYPGSSVTFGQVKDMVTHLFSTYPLSDSVKLAILFLLHTIIPNLDLNDLSPQNSNFKPIINTSDMTQDDKDTFFVLDVKKQIDKLVQKFKLSWENLELNLFIDGFSIDDKTSQQFWRIIGYVTSPSLSYKNSTSKSNVIVVGISKPYRDKSKPSRCFIKKAFNQIKNSNIKIGKIILDLPAKNYLLGHSAFNCSDGCVNCFINVERVESVPVFKYDYFIGGNYTEKTSQHYHLGIEDCFETYPLIPEYLVPSACIIDILHCFGQGLCKRLLECLLTTKHGHNNYITIKDFKTKFQDTLASVKLPQQSSIDHHDLKFQGSWKSKTCIYFFLYFVTILKPFVPIPTFQSLILLSDIIYLTSHKPKLSEEDYKSLHYIVHDLFCVDFTNVWGIKNCSANFHNFIHLVAEIKKLDF